jgi:hypothetical protein
LNSSVQELFDHIFLISSIPIPCQSIFIVDNSLLVPFTANPTQTLYKSGIKHHTQLVVYMNDKPQESAKTTDTIEPMSILIRLEGEPLESAIKERIYINSNQSKNNCRADNRQSI